MDDTQNKKIAVLILKNAVIIPNTIVPVLLAKFSSIKSLEKALTQSNKIAIFLQKNGDANINNTDNIHTFGSLVEIVEIIKNAKGKIKVLFEGLSKITLVNLVKEDEIHYGTYQLSKTISNFENQLEKELSWKTFLSYYEKYRLINIKITDCIIPKSYSDTDFEIAINVIAGNILNSSIDKQNFLNIIDLESRLNFLINFINREITIFHVEEKIKINLQSQLETTQKEYYLKEQLKAIQKELSLDQEDENNEQKIKKKAKEKGVPSFVFEKIEKELKKIDQMQELSTEASVTKSYIDWLISLPWKNESIDTISINQAQKILDSNHYGLQKVKERIIEYISAQKYAKNSIKSIIICLVGPPGVGKTSLAKSIALSLNREFVRISLGGIRDEADIRGHRKTYVAAMPGKIIQGFKKITTINPVFLLDEIDKMSHDLHGDPSSALLEVLDPIQNQEFIDSYLEVPYDISKTIFIATANHLDNIPYPLLDRLEIIQLSGYTVEEKVHIGKNFLIPKILTEHNLLDKLFFSNEAINYIVTEYTKEAGVRQLERLLIRLTRKAIAKEFLPEINLEKKNNLPLEKKVLLNKDTILEYLKSPLFKLSAIKHTEKIGIVTGLAWTELGGDILEIEVAIVPGKGNIILTGQLGDVMQESAQAALTYLKTKLDLYGISKKKIQDSDIHIHVPEGATPKDGPSAGIAICTALASAFTQTPVKSKLVMTGEITLQGRILPIGGIKEKLLAAESYKYDIAILPKENKELTEEILLEIENLQLKIVYFDYMDDVLQFALTKDISLANKKITKKIIKTISRIKKNNNDTTLKKLIKE